MKCICGYERVDKWRLGDKLEGDPNFKNGDEDFNMSAHPVRIDMQEEYYGRDGIEDKYLYACPKCGTVKIDL